MARGMSVDSIFEAVNIKRLGKFDVEAPLACRIPARLDRDICQGCKYVAVGDLSDTRTG